MNQRELMTKYGQIWKIGSCVYEILEPFLFKLDTLYIFASASSQITPLTCIFQLFCLMLIYVARESQT